MNHVEVLEGFEVAIAALLDKVTMCEHYARVYMGDPLPQLRNQSTICSGLPEFYAAVIVFSVKARTYFEAKGMHAEHIRCYYITFAN